MAQEAIQGVGKIRKESKIMKFKPRFTDLSSTPCCVNDLKFLNFLIKKITTELWYDEPPHCLGLDFLLYITNLKQMMAKIPPSSVQRNTHKLKKKGKNKSSRTIPCWWWKPSMFPLVNLSQVLFLRMRLGPSRNYLLLFKTLTEQLLVSALLEVL